MVVVLLVLVAVVAVIGLALFLRSVFGGATFAREPRTRGRKDDDAGRGPRADHHAGNGRWTGGGGLGTWNTWSDH